MVEYILYQKRKNTMNKPSTVSASILANQVKQKIQSFPMLIQGKKEEMKMKIRQEISQVFH